MGIDLTFQKMIFATQTQPYHKIYSSSVRKVRFSNKGVYTLHQVRAKGCPLVLDVLFQRIDGYDGRGNN